jgi:hypothetical protein
LDRCLPDESIDILEALKLLLEDPALAERVQVLVLMDEEPLGVAIREKFRALIDARGSDSADAIVREHKEKLFLCALRLPELNPEEVKELLAAYTAVAPDTTSRTENTESYGGPSPRGPKGSAPVLASRRADLFTQQERDFLRDAVIRALPPGNVAPTPRQIRSFLSKYQIARALCAYRPVSDPSATTHGLAQGLAKAVFSNIAPNVPPNETEGRFTIEQIIADVV